MKTDTNLVNFLEIVGHQDTIKLSIEKSVFNNLHQSKSNDGVQVISILAPILSAILILWLTRLFDSKNETRKFKIEVLKESRAQKIKYLKFLNELKTSLYKTNFPDADYSDFWEWTADRMIGVNPFYDLKVNSMVIFNDEVVELANSLYQSAEKIERDFDWGKKEHPDTSKQLGKEILEDLDKIILKIKIDLRTLPTSGL